MRFNYHRRFDIEMIVASVRRAGRCMILHKASRFGGFGGEFSALGEVSEGKY